MRIVTWNINSVRLRQDLVLRLIDDIAPDILCLQETKCPDELFPREPFIEKGYEHIALAGMKGYNGVAILSRLPLEGHEVQHWCGREDCRHIMARLPGGPNGSGMEIHNLYIPAGGDIPDPDKNEKFAHKLQFLDEMTAWWSASRQAETPMVVVGDLNIAPLEHDVWSHKQLLKVVSHTPIEVEKLTAMQRTLGWVDAVRHFVPEDEKLYSWWSYRARDWEISNRGRRLDHIWVTPPLAGGLRQAKIETTARGWEPKPSDHAPVWVDIKV